MPTTNDPKHRHARQSPHARRKSKPKFEIPAETGLPEAPVGWVYRAEEVPAPAVVATANEERSKTNPLLAAGMGLVFIAAGSVGLVSVVALGLIAAPIRRAQGMFVVGGRA